MGTITWHEYGYGICTDDIICDSVDKMKSLLHMAPKYESCLNERLKELGNDELTYEDYIELENGDSLGLAQILFEVVKEAEKLEFLACNDLEQRCYFIFPVTYPWRLSGREKKLTEEKVKEILQKYIAVLTDDDIDISYQEIENCG